MLNSREVIDPIVTDHWRAYYGVCSFRIIEVSHLPIRNISYNACGTEKLFYARVACRKRLLSVNFLISKLFFS